MQLDAILLCDSSTSFPSLPNFFFLGSGVGGFSRILKDSQGFSRILKDSQGFLRILEHFGEFRGRFYGCYPRFLKILGDSLRISLE